jgi:hypothetical protein
MTSKVPYLKLSSTMIEWNPVLRSDGTLHTYWNYICWWNILSKEYRSWGYTELDYDCQPHRAFNFYFFNISWCLG